MTRRVDALHIYSLFGMGTQRVDAERLERGEDSRRSKRSALLNTQLETAVNGRGLSAN